MRVATFISVVALAFVAAASAQAAPAVSKVNVAIGPDLAKKSKDLGAREFDTLTKDLRRSVESELNRRGSLSPDGGELNLVIDDAKPNRPTFEQLRNSPGLSYQSFSVGGAAISGEYIAPSGVRTPVSYDWYENDIREAPYSWTWRDARFAFDLFARRVARDQLTDR